MAPTKPHPEPITIPPTLAHKHTLILLHGRGSTAQTFSSALLSTPIPTSPAPTTTPQAQTQTLPSILPHTKLIFPSAPHRRATLFKRLPIPQWFDNYSLSNPSFRQELQSDGLRETGLYIHALLREEIMCVGARNVVLGGLSQGWAGACVAMLLWEGEALGGAVGMCGWLPFEGSMREVLRGEEPDDVDDDDDPFAREEEAQQEEDDDGLVHPSDELSLSLKAVAYLRDELELPPPSSSSLPFRHTPVFIGHGTKDEKVGVGLGRDAANFLGEMGVETCWKEYRGLGHWYSGEMLEDLVGFLKDKVGWEAADDGGGDLGGWRGSMLADRGKLGHDHFCSSLLAE